MTGILRPENALQVVRGSSKTIDLTVTNEDGNPVDLTGSTVYFTVKRLVTDASPLIQKKSSDALEIDIFDPRGGVARIYLNPADTQNLALNPYVFDVWVVLSSGKRYPVVGPATFDMLPSVTVIPVS
jgi:hypothetical protein